MKKQLIALSVIVLFIQTGLLAQNFTGEKGKGGMAKLGEGAASHEARELGQGYKVSPYIIIEPHAAFPKLPTKDDLEVR